MKCLVPCILNPQKLYSFILQIYVSSYRCSILVDNFLFIFYILFHIQHFMLPSDLLRITLPGISVEFKVN